MEEERWLELYSLGDRLELHEVFPVCGWRRLCWWWVAAVVLSADEGSVP
eukprot:COSAG06_NODE_66219_length_255_cov_0.512821_2_plen_48_part_01